MRHTSLSHELDPVVSLQLRDGLCELWVAVTNAGGAIGFVPPVAAEDVRPDLMAHLAAVDAGRTRLLVGRDGKGTVLAAAFLVLNGHRLKRHWCTVNTVMVHPALQGRGHGRAGAVLRELRLPRGGPAAGGHQGRGGRSAGRRGAVAGGRPGHGAGNGPGKRPGRGAGVGAGAGPR